MNWMSTCSLREERAGTPPRPDWEPINKTPTLGCPHSYIHVTPPPSHHSLSESAWQPIDEPPTFNHDTSHAFYSCTSEHAHLSLDFPALWANETELLSKAQAEESLSFS